MPLLPNLGQLTDEQAARVMAAYAPGGTQAEAVAAYKRWLRDGITRKMQEAEAEVIREQSAADIRKRVAEVEVVLPPEP